MDEKIKTLCDSIDYNMEKLDKEFDSEDNKFVQLALMYDAIKFDYEMLKDYLKVTK